jgi:hypothetical protein
MLNCEGERRRLAEAVTPLIDLRADNPAGSRFFTQVLRQAITDTFARYRTSSRYRPLTGADRD